MATTLRNLLATVVVLLTAGSMLGCLGIHDLTPPNGTDASTSEASASDDATTENNDDATTNTNDDAATGADGGSGQACVSGATCNPTECQTGKFACAGGSGKCNKTGNVPDGTPCGSAAGSVCHAGTCGTCAAGADCTDMANPCVKKTTDCSSGQAVCKAAMNAPDGTTCGTGLFCNGGVCSACAVGNACSPASNACHTGKVTACTGGAITCTDQGAPAPAGASCQTSTTPSGVCDGNGLCVACATNAACTPAGKPCQQGTMTCTMGPVCGSAMNINESKACGSGQICSAGACVACSATSCPSGCCDGTGCVTSAQTGSNCGTKGAACAPCAGGQVCTMGGGGCSCPPAAGTSCSGTCTNVQTDAKNCGACANDCTTKPHVMAAGVTCNAGVCSVPSCAPGWGHCTTNPADICETDLSQMTHCGGCNTVCAATTPMCVKAPAGTYSCGSGCVPPAMTVCGGTCTDTDTDAKNCGGCGTVCPAQSCNGGMLTAASTCSGGKCVMPLPMACGGFACNGTACFTSCSSSNEQTNCPPTAQYCIAGKCAAQKLQNGAPCNPSAPMECIMGNCVGGVCCNQQCGGQCDSCTGPGPVGTCGGATAGKSCSPGVSNALGQCDGNRNCTLTGCANGFCMSGQACVSWNNTPNKCGPSCLDCTQAYPNTAGPGTCVGGTCQLNCAAGFAHCISDVTKGCETNISNDVFNCGGCNQTCAPCVSGSSAAWCGRDANNAIACAAGTVQTCVCLPSGPAAQSPGKCYNC